MRSLYLNYPISIPHNMPDGIAAGVKREINSVSEIYGKFTMLQNEIMASTDLTKNGKAKRLTDLGTELLREFAVIEKSSNGYDTNIKNRMSKMIIKKQDVTVLSFLQEKEIRDILYELDPLLVEAAYRKAVSENDTSILNAVENAPSLKKLVKPEIIETLKMQRLESIYPTESREIGHLKTAKNLIAGAITTAKSELAESGVVFPEPSLIMKIASGEN